MDLVSVLMSTYKEPVSWIEKSVESILSQTYTNIEYVIVIDDPTNKEVVDFLNRKEESDSRIVLVKNEKNIGLVDSLNKGLEYCSGSYIARMDADDISMQNRIEKQMELAKKECADIVGANTQTFFKEKISKEKIIYSSAWACRRVLRWISCCPHPTWLVKKEIYARLNGYRSIMACEDYDFLIRASIAGAKIINCPEPLLLYRDNLDSISHTNNYHQLATAEFLAKGYRNRHVLSLEEINGFLNSQHYENKIMSLKLYDQEHKKNIQRGISLMIRNKYIAIVKYCDYAIGKLRRK